MEKGSGNCEAKVARRLHMFGWALLGLSLLVFCVGYSYAAPKRSAVWYTVGSGTESIRVRSYVKGKLVLDRSIDVVPGQVFRMDPE